MTNVPVEHRYCPNTYSGSIDFFFYKKNNRYVLDSARIQLRLGDTAQAVLGYGSNMA